MEEANFRSFLQQQKHLINDLRGQSKSRQIYIVSKHWHDRLMEWVKGETDELPGPIINAPLMSGDTFDMTKKYRLDFMIVEGSVWEKLKSFFGCDHEIPRRLTIHPLTSCTVVLTNPIALEMYPLQHNAIRKTMGDDWVLRDIKRPLCHILRLIAEEHTFATFDANEPVDDSMKTGEYVARFGTKIRLRRKFSEASVTDYDYQSYKMSAAVPSLTFPNCGGNFMKSLPGKRSSSMLEIKLPRPVGLINMGNYCYFNAPVQCLIRVPPLIKFVQSPEFNADINWTNPAGSGGKIAEEFQKLVQVMAQPGNQARDGRSLRREVARDYPQFATMEQLDAQEMLCAIIDGLHEDLSKIHTAKDGLTPRSRNLRALYPTKPMSVIGDMFYGSLMTKITCPNCKKDVTLYDPFLCLSLPIPPKPDYQSCTLRDCIHTFLKGDRLEGDNRWECNNCRMLVCAVKHTSIYSSPPILLFHLKRFSAYQRFTRKIDTAVEYPDTLRMEELSTTARGNYKLIGVVNHAGTISSGHYTSAAIDPSTGKWYSFNDAYVAPASKSVIHSGRAYLLFYEKME